MNWFSSLDVRVLQSLYDGRNLDTTLLWISVTELGEATLIIGLTVCIALLLAARRQYRYAIGALSCVASATLLSTAIKLLVHRPRPATNFHAYLGETGYSFPSAHAALTFALTFFCAYLVALFWPRYRWVAWTLAIVITLFVGFSRLYLGVHYLTDVLVGYVVGAFGFWIGLFVIRVTRHFSSSTE